MQQAIKVEKKMVYSWRNAQSVRTQSAQVFGETLESIKANGDHGDLPRAIVEHAKSTLSPIHNFFEWNNAIAGEKYRLSQARQFVAVLQVQEPTTGKTVRAYVNLPATDESRRNYESIVTVLSDEELREQMVAQALTELENWKKRYEDLVELVHIFEALKRPLKKMQRAERGRPNA